CVKMDIYIGGRKTTTVYSFLVDGMLIDTGPQRMEDDLIPFYENHMFDLVALTHNDEDHTGTAPWIQQHRGVPIYILPKGIELCKQDYPYPEYRQRVWGKREKFAARTIGDTV